ncbi:MAG: substrate-binding domain-containing protein [Candidatus Binataceae bacterium]
MAQLRDQLRLARAAHGLSQNELARRAGISRQALGAIEAGQYQPGVSVALALARELGATVEALFGADSPNQVAAAVPVSVKLAAGSHVALARVGGRVVAIPAAAVQHNLTAADGIVSAVAARSASIAAYVSADEIDATLIVAGCDPAVSLLADWVARRHPPIRIVALARGSMGALEALLGGRAHVAGVHLRDTKSGEYNLGPVRRALKNRHTAIIRFASWELGLATAPGNPLGIGGFEDLRRPRLRLINRERGAGARIALDDAIAALKLKPSAIAGYNREVGGHLEVALAIAARQGDLGVTIRVAAQAYGLGFVPIREERYDLAVPAGEMSSAPVRAMLEAINSSRFATEVAGLCGYDTHEMGALAANL